MPNLQDPFLSDLHDLSDIDNNDHMEYDISLSMLEKTQRYKHIINKVEHKLGLNQAMVVLEEDDHDQLISECNTLSVDIDNQILIIHNFIRDNYRLKFPELESLVRHPIDYARVVKQIGNEVDLTLVDLQGLLPSPIILVISVTASTTTGKPLPHDVLINTIEACDRALTLNASKNTLLEFVEARMGYVAPNLSAVVGSAVAAKLMVAAGGLTALANTPSCNVCVGYVEQTEVFRITPPVFKTRVCRVLASKLALAARVDSIRGDPSGKQGRLCREEIRKKIEKWQEPFPARQPKPLPVPEYKHKKKRGGRRLRKMRERYGITDMRKLANRMQFGVAEESSLGDGLGEGYGMLFSKGGKKVVAKRFKGKQYSSGLITSSLDVQGIIDLTDPQADATYRLGSGTQSTYFSETGTFSKIKT